MEQAEQSTSKWIGTTLEDSYKGSVPSILKGLIFWINVLLEVRLGFTMLCYPSFSSQGFHNNSFRVSGMHWPPASFARGMENVRIIS